MPDTKDIPSLTGGDNGSVAGVAPQPDSAYVAAVKAVDEAARRIELVDEVESRPLLVARLLGQLMKKPERPFGGGK